MNASKKNILIVAYNDLNNSGVPNVIFQTVKTISKSVNSIDIIVFGDNLFFYEKMLQNGIKNVNIIPQTICKDKSKIKSFWNFIYKNKKEAYRNAIKTLGSKNYYAIHSFKEYSGWPYLKAAKKLGIKLRITHSNVNASRKVSLIETVYRFFAKRKTSRYATELVGVSKDCCEASFHGKNYIVLHNSYDENKFNKDVINELPKNKLVLTQVGSLNSNKNQYFSLGVIEELIKLHKDSQLIIVGKETEFGYQTKLNNLVIKKDLTNYVKIINQGTDISKLFKETSYVLIPSLYEGASIVAIESQACGIKTFVSKGVPKEMNIGGLTFLDLKDGPKKWAEEIFKNFLNTGNSRAICDMSVFSNKQFEEKILSIYNLSN